MGKKWKEFSKTCPWSIYIYQVGYPSDYRKCEPFRWGGGQPRECCEKNCGLWALHKYLTRNYTGIDIGDFEIK